MSPGAAQAAQGGVPHPEADARGWHRGVGWPALIGVSLVILALWLALMVSLLWWWRDHWQGLALIDGLPVHIELPAGLEARAEVHSVLNTHVDLRQRVVVPIDQMLQVQVPGPIQARARVQAQVPVRTSVALDAVIPVRTEVQAQVPLVSWLPAMTVNLPVAFDVSVKVQVPVDTVVPLDLDLAVRTEVPGTLNVPLKTRVHATVPVKADLRAQMTREASFNLSRGIDDLPIVVTKGLMHLPFKDVSWLLRDGQPLPITCLGWRDGFVASDRCRNAGAVPAP